MPTPTSSATSPQGFSCCWSVLCSHTTVHPLRPLCLPFLFKCTLEVHPPQEAGVLGSSLTATPAFTPSAGTQLLCSVTLLCREENPQPKVDVLLPSRLDSPLSPQWRTLTSQTGLERCVAEKQPEKNTESLCCREKEGSFYQIMMLQR